LSPSVAGRPPGPATLGRLGGPLPRQQADRPRAPPRPKKLSTLNHAEEGECPVLIPVSGGYPRARGRLLTCYSPVRRSSTPKGLSARLACVKHAASVRPEPGSNSPLNDQHPRPEDPGNQKPNHELKAMAENPQRNNPEEPSRDGGLVHIMHWLLTRC